MGGKGNISRLRERMEALEQEPEYRKYFEVS
jgi:hypothetical protein